MTSSEHLNKHSSHPRSAEPAVGFRMRRRFAIMLSFGMALTVGAIWLVKTEPSLTSEQLFQRGLAAIREQRWDDLQRIQERLRILESGGERAVLEAQAALARKEFGKALRLAIYAEQIQPELQDYTHAVCVESLYSAGQLAQAEALALEWLSTRPDHPVAHRWLGAIYYDLGAMEQARVHLSRLIELKPEDPMPRYLLGMIFHDYERFSEAVETFRELLRLSSVPQSTRDDSQQRLAESLMRLNRFPEALEVLRAGPKTAVALARSADCQLSMGELQQARVLIAEAASMNPTDATVLDVQSKIQLEDMLYAEAEVTLKDLIRQDACHVQANHRLAQCLRLQGRTEEADQQLQVFESCQKTMLRLADLHREAIMNPWDPDRRDQIADLLETIGRHEKAIMWRNAAAACRQSLSPEAAALPDSSSPASPQDF